MSGCSIANNETKTRETIKEQSASPEKSDNGSLRTYDGSIMTYDGSWPQPSPPMHLKGFYHS